MNTFQKILLIVLGLIIFVVGYWIYTQEKQKRYFRCKELFSYYEYSLIPGNLFGQDKLDWFKGKQPKCYQILFKP